MNKKLRLIVIIFGILLFIGGVILLILDVVASPIAITLIVGGIAAIINPFKWLNKYN